MFPQAYYLIPAGWAHLLVFGVLLPLLVLHNARSIARRTLPLPERILHFKSTAMMLTLWLAISISVAMVQRIELFPRDVPHLWRGLAAGVAMYVAAVLVMRPLWRRTVLQRARIVHLFVADTTQERAWWVLVSLLAGIGEEITWRGVQTALLVPLVGGNYWAAAALSGVSFAAAHGIQGWKSAAGIFLFALAFQGVVVASGSLYVAMAVHVAYDITAGWTYGRLARETGYPSHPERSEGSAVHPPTSDSSLRSE